MNAFTFAVFCSKGLKASNFSTPSPANRTFGDFDVSFAVVSLSVPAPLLRTVSSTVPTSPSSRMPSWSQVMTSSLIVPATMDTRLPTTKLSFTPTLLLLSRAGPTAPTPAPRFANAFQKSSKSFGSFAYAAAMTASRASSSVGEGGVSLRDATR